MTWVPSIAVGPQMPQLAARIMRSPSLARRAAPSSRSMAQSAVASVSTSGVLVTIRPRALAAARSMWSKPTEKLAGIFTASGRLAMSLASNLSVGQINSPSAPLSTAAAISPAWA